MRKPMSVWKRILASALSAAMVVTSMTVAPDTTVMAASNKVVKKLSVSKKKLSLTQGKASTVTATVKATKKVAAKYLKVSAKSNKKGVCKVSLTSQPKKKGKSGKTTLKLTAVKAGTAEITVTAKAKNKKGKKVVQKINVTVKANKSSNTKETTDTKKTTDDTKKYVAVTGLNASLSKSTVLVGGAVQVVASVVPTNATDKTITYISSDPSTAQVNAAGTVTGIKAGDANIIVVAGGLTRQLPIKVEDVSVTSVSFGDRTAMTLEESKSEQLKHTILPENATNKEVVWDSDNKEVATVTQDGLVTAVKAGTANISCTSKSNAEAKAVCQVTVQGNSTGLTDGVMDLKVTNPYKDNKGNTPYEYLVLAGEYMNLRGRVIRDGKPASGASVSIKMEPVYGNSANAFELDKKTGETNDQGYFEFNITPKDSSMRPIDNVVQTYKLTVSSGDKSKEINVSFGSIYLPGVSRSAYYTMDQESEKIVSASIEPSDNASAHDTGEYVTYSTGGYGEQYVTSQQVSTFDDSHKLIFDAAPRLRIPAKNDETKSDDYNPPFVQKRTGSYSIYNDITNETTTTVIEEVPAGLKSMSLMFSEFKLSRYSVMNIDVYSSETGENIYSTTRDYTSNETPTLQIERQTDEPCYIVISVVSAGQVEADNKGYTLDGIKGQYQTENRENGVLVPIEDSVEWTVETQERSKKYESAGMSAIEAQKYIDPVEGKEFIDKNFTYKVFVPVFPVVGNAVIEVFDGNNKHKGWLLYPTINENSVNKIAPLYTNKVYDRQADMFVEYPIYAIVASEEEVNRTEVTKFVQEGNNAVVDAELTGYCQLKATLKVNALADKNYFTDTTASELHTFVQWSPQPYVEENTSPDYFALENQSVTITARLTDRAGNIKTDPGKSIEFTDSYLKTINSKTPSSTKIGGDGKDNDAATFTSLSNNGATDSNGQVSMTLTGAAGAYVEAIQAESPGYRVQLCFGDINASDAKWVESGDINWIDLGLSYYNTAVNIENVSRITRWESGSQDITDPMSSKVGIRWFAGFQPVARSHVFDYEDDDRADRTRYTKKSFISIKGVGIYYSKEGEMTVSNKDNSYAEITATKTGSAKLIGQLEKPDDSKDVVVTYFDENGEVVQAKSVGKSIGATTTTELKLPVIWSVNGLEANLYTSVGNMISAEEGATVYVKVVDSQGNVRPNERIKYSVSGAVTIAEKEGSTDEKGLFAFELPKADNIPEEGQECIVNVKVADDLSLTGQYRYVVANNAKTAITNIEYYGSRKDQLLVTFNNKLSDSSAFNKTGFSFKQDGTDDTTYKVTNVALNSGDNGNLSQIIVTLDKAVVNQDTDHTLSITGYKDTNGATCYLADEFGRKITNVSGKFRP